MSDDIPFDKDLNLAPDTVDEPMPGIRRIMANNPGPFTFKGTISYLIGRGNVAIVDPGPDDALRERVLRAAAACPVEAILVGEPDGEAERRRAA